MAKAKKSGRSSTSRSASSRTRAGGRAGARKKLTGRPAESDAIGLLKADHRQVEGWFEEFEGSGSDTRKQELANKICQALKMHTQIEEEIFYPAFLHATNEENIHHEAEVEHEGAKRLIADIEASGPDDDYFAAKIKVLSEMIKHHVNEEEKRGGMFTKASQSELDLEALGRQLAERKAELMSEEDGAEEARSTRAGQRSVSRNGTMPRAVAKPHA